MANPKPKKPDPKKAREKALAQWRDPAKRERILAGLRKSNAIEPPKDAAHVIEKAAANGCTVAQIASALEVSPQTFRKWKEDYPEIRDAFDAGRAAEHDALVGVLFAQAMKGSVVPAIFLLKARHGLVEGAPPSPNTVSINFLLPGSLTPEAYTASLAAGAQAIPPDGARALLDHPKVKRAVKNDLYRERRAEENAE